MDLNKDLMVLNEFKDLMDLNKDLMDFMLLKNNLTDLRVLKDLSNFSKLDHMLLSMDLTDLSE